MKLVLRKTWPESQPYSENDFVVAIAGQEKALARVIKERSSYREAWGWSVYGFNIPQTDEMRGSESTFEEAKGKTKACILRLLAENTPLMPEPAEWRPGSAFVK